MKRFPKKSDFQPSKMRQIVFFQAQIYIKNFWIASKSLRDKDCSDAISKQTAASAITAQY